MRVYVYKNNLCDPVRNIGTCRLLPNATAVDDYVRMFVAAIDPRYISNWRIFITNDEVEFVEVDHYVLMDEPYGLGLGREKVKEVNVKAWAEECNEVVGRLAKARRLRAEAARKAAKEAAERIKTTSNN